MAEKSRIAGDFSLMLDYGIDPKARRIFLHAGITHPDDSDASAGENPTEYVVRALMHLGQNPSRPIELWLNTPGGDCYEMWAIHDIIKSAIKSPVITVGFGAVCSAGGPILVCGDHRFATEHCMFMTHEMISETGGIPRRAARARARAEDKVHERTLELLGEYTAHNAEWWKNLDETKPEQWYTAKQMKQHGIIDEIYSAEAIKDLGFK